MRKYLLMLAGLMFAVCSANAQYVTSTRVQSNRFYKSVSPNGRYAASGDEYTGVIIVTDLSNLTANTYKPTEEEGFYELGFGANTVSNNGVVVFSTSYDGGAAYGKNGQINILPLPEGVTSSICTSITPDGSRIAGTIGMVMSTEAKDVMQRPVIWNLLPDGTYSDPIELPYPMADLTGRTPQYILVDGISADGKTLACNVVDYLGELCQPMILKEDADGNWEYTLLAEDFLNPEKREFPEYPGESPYPGNYMTQAEADAYNKAAEDAFTRPQPLPKDFMTPENRAAYEAATPEYGTAPNPRDYMTDEEYNEYLAAVDQYYENLYPKPEDYMYPEHREAYLQAIAEWKEKYEAFEAVITQVQNESVNFGMNELVLSPNGKYYAIAGSAIDEQTGTNRMKVYVFNLQTGVSHISTAAEEDFLIPRFVTDDGRILASSVFTVQSKGSSTYFASSPGEPFLALQDIAKDNDKTVYDFMSKNMLHKMWVWDDDLEDDIQIDKWITGVGCCDADMQTVITWATLESWGENNMSVYSYSYLMPTPFLKAGTTALQAVNENTAAETALNGIYDINGRRVSTNSAALSHGVYLVKTPNGTRKVVK